MTTKKYLRQLTPQEIAAGAHREMVGGLWEEVGKLQFDFLVGRGLRPGHRLLDVGCGALRGGVHFVRYLERGRYCGLDVNESLLAAGRQELERAGLAGRDAQLIADEAFSARRFGVKFDFALALSLFTHLPMDPIVRCLVEVRDVLAPGGRFFATWFEAPRPASLEPIRHEPGGVTTRYDADPFHRSFAEMQALAAFARMEVERIGDFGHPRGQRMLCFTLPER